MIKVVNKRSGTPGEYIGRPSVLGNPFVIGRDGTRDEVIAKYRVWLNDQLHESEAVGRELSRLTDLARDGDLNLVCWCAPQACHGDVVKSCIEWMLSADDSPN